MSALTALAIQASHALVLGAATPSPAPSIPSADKVTPGPWGFASIFGVGVLVVLLVWDMMRRIRRVRYRAEVTEKLDAEQAEQAEGRGGPGSGPSI